MKYEPKGSSIVTDRDRLLSYVNILRLWLHKTRLNEGKRTGSVSLNTGIMFFYHKYLN